MSRTIKKCTITLLSDMCCGTGEGSAAYYDAITAVDGYGFPVIPSKRLKGLLREAACLIAYDNSHKTMVDELFGISGTQQGKIRLSEARLQGADEVIAASKAGSIDLPHPSVVTSFYTTGRAGTTIDYDGVAKDQTLHRVQVVNSVDPEGNPQQFVFFIDCEGITPQENEFLEKSVKCLRSVGLKQSRGFGEVSCTCSDVAMLDEERACEAKLEDQDGSDFLVIPYKITLEQDVIVSNGMGKPVQYIPGGTLQGAIATLCAGEEWFVDEVLQNSRFSNAYIATPTGSIAFPAGLSLAQEKNANLRDQEKNANSRAEEYKVYDKAERPLPGADGSGPFRQFVSCKGFMDMDETARTVNIVDVAQSVSFHNSGAKTAQGKQFYSHAHISSGQVFRGTIVAQKSAYLRMKNILGARQNKIALGAAITSGFGKCQIELEDPTSLQSLNIQKGDLVEVTLRSDLIYYDKNGMNNVNAAKLAKELVESRALGFCAEPKTENALFTKSVVVGGYNAYWRLPKRQMLAFSMGSVLVFRALENVDSVPQEVWFGACQTEGYGQLHLRCLGASDGALASSASPFHVHEDASSEKETSCEKTCSKAQTSVALAHFKQSQLCFELRSALEVEREVQATKFPLALASKSAAMRIGNAFGAAQINTLEATAKQETPDMAEEFLKETNARFKADQPNERDKDKNLREACVQLVDAYRNACKEVGIGEDSVVLPQTKLNRLFEEYLQGFLQLIKRRYDVEGAFEEKEGAYRDARQQQL